MPKLPKWKLSPINIKVIGWVKQGCPLAVNPTDISAYTVTHLESGFCLGSCGLTLERAQRLAEELSVLDWNFSNPADISKRTCRTAILSLRKAVSEHGKRDAD